MPPRYPTSRPAGHPDVARNPVPPAAPELSHTPWHFFPIFSLDTCFTHYENTVNYLDCHDPCEIRLPGPYPHAG
jgi:hypothetical protein